MQRVVWVACLVVSVAAGLAGAQVPQTPVPATPPTGLIVGRVLDGRTNDPVPSAVVTLQWAPVGGRGGRGAGVPSPQRVITNADGYFFFTRIAKGTYSLIANKSGVGSGGFGMRTPRIAPVTIDIGEGERIGGITIPFWSTAAIGGTVVDEAGEPMVGIDVRVLSRSTNLGRERFMAGPVAGVTDDRGVYRIAGLRPGDYIVVISQSRTTLPAGVVEGLTGPGKTVDTLARGGAANLTRNASHPASADTERVGDLVLQTPGRSVPTPPASRAIRRLMYETTFYPATDTATSATVITLESGDERRGVDFHLRPVATSRVSGRVIAPDGPAAFVPMRLMSSGVQSLSDDADLPTAMALSDANGEFTFLGVPPGQYTVRVVNVPPLDMGLTFPQTTVQTSTGTTTVSAGVAVAGGPPAPSKAPTLWAAQPLSVGDTDVSGLAVTLRIGLRVSGRAAFEGSRAQSSTTLFQICTVELDAADGRGTFDLPTAFGRPDGTFYTWGTPAGRYLLVVRCNLPGMKFKSAMRDGHDLTIEPFDLDGDISDVVLTFTDNSPQVSGTVRDAAGAPDAGAVVRMFSTDPRRWSDFGGYPRMLLDTRTDRAGAFVVGDSPLGLPAGEYFIVAVPDAEAYGYDFKSYEKLSQIATRITVADGEKKTIDLRTVIK